ncbi:MAG: putative secreted protein [Actinoallomurus sp.]|nr:putative secreted protein [Actinoallomurus sp.]
MPWVREGAGRHEYDGRIPDYSVTAVRAALDRVGRGDPLADPHDEAHLRAFEEYLRAAYGELELHRRSPLDHLSALDLACYDRDYAPAAERAAARMRQLAGWPEAIDTAVRTLDLVPAPVAKALVAAVRGLAAGIPADSGETGEKARGAHARLVAHIEHLAEHGDPDAALGGQALTRLMGDAEALDLDLTALAVEAGRERDRLMARLTDACARTGRSTPPLELSRELVRDHPDIDGVMDASRYWTERALAFTRERDLVPYHDGECRIGPAPESRRWGMAMMSWAAPGEPEGPSWYHITPPDPSWPAEDIEDWLQVFSATTLPGVTVHEVAPGHFSHGRALRHAPTMVRRTLQSDAFAEGWAHYAEELCVEEGFLADDPRFEIGVWLEALVRVTRLACAIGVHTGAMTVAEGARRFAADTHLAGSAARAEAERAVFDPAYGRYTLGKLEILRLRDQARDKWGTGYSHGRFHRALLELGSPPLGLIGAALA